jgi:tetratricopeptide (TPR) repeat protein
MKLIFAAAAAALAICASAQAAPMQSLGLKPAQECTNAAGARGLTDRQMQAAMAACNTALSGDLSKQARAGTLVNRGLLKVAMHDDRAAIADFTAATAQDGKLSAAYMNRGTALLRAGRYAEASADFDQGIALNGADLHVAYFNRGEAQEAAGNVNAAYHDYRKAQELSPGFQPAALELARFQVAPRRLADNHG